MTARIAGMEPAAVEGPPRWAVRVFQDNPFMTMLPRMKTSPIVIAHPRAPGASGLRGSPTIRAIQHRVG